MYLYEAGLTPSTLASHPQAHALGYHKDPRRSLGFLMAQSVSPGPSAGQVFNQVLRKHPCGRELTTSPTILLYFEQLCLIKHSF